MGSEVHEKRREFNINRVFKLVDTCAAEFQAQTPYYYSSFESNMIVDGKAFSENESEVSDRKKIVVLGSGPNRIGQGIEFDYCCVHGVLAAKECGYETNMINCNLRLFRQILILLINFTLSQYSGSISGILFNWKNLKA